MANVFSTATLGLRVDTSTFNSALSSAGLSANRVFASMASGADQFKASWDDATRGIKDTKRIISGILISQGFYSLMNGLTYAASEALTFAANMETAAVSTRYFVEGTDKAAKSLAYLREMNTFAARTPFSTEAAIELSKYIQAVGVSMNVSKSFLQTITDAAAATGATEENLQRIVFALGQMKTKGRIANEEIRQLANANIPIYEILKEELNLTGDQISNIGKYWVDADKAIVAILDGLNKRYKGASQEISNTMTGMLDTIADDAKIIAQEAGDGIFNGISGGMRKVRDLLDEYRTIATEMGSAGLFNEILLDIDPTGEFGNRVLVLIGNARQLVGALSDLAAASAPVAKLFSEGLYAGINTVTIGATALSRTIEGLEEVLDKLGITSGSVGATLGQLYVMYQAGKWGMTLGQGALYATQHLYNMGATVVTTLVPSMTAGQASVWGLVGSLAALAAAGVAIYALLGNLNSFAGLDMTMGEIFPTDYEAEMDRYLAEMEEYNAQIARYQAQFNTPYDAMTDGSAAAIEGLEDTSKASKKAANSVKHDWVAAFDEVYQVPTFNDSASGSGAKLPELPDLGELLSKPGFKFPTLEAKLEKPAFNWDEVFGGGLLSDTTLNKDWWKAFLPAVLTGALMGAGAHFVKKPRDIDASGGKKGTKVDVNDAKTRAKVLGEFRDTLSKAQSYYDDAKKLIADGNEALPGSTNARGVSSDRLLGTSKQLNKLVSDIEGQYEVLMESADAVKALPGNVDEVLSQLRTMSAQTEQLGLEQKLKEIKAVLTSDAAKGLPAGQISDLLGQQEKAEKQLAALLAKNAIPPKFYSSTVPQLMAEWQRLGEKLSSDIGTLAHRGFASGPDAAQLAAEGRRYTVKTLEDIKAELNLFTKLGNLLETQLPELIQGTKGPITSAVQLRALLAENNGSFIKALDSVINGKPGTKKVDPKNVLSDFGAQTETFTVAYKLHQKELKEANRLSAARGRVEGNIKQLVQEGLKEQKKQARIASKNAAAEAASYALDTRTTAAIADAIVQSTQERTHSLGELLQLVKDEFEGIQEQLDLPRSDSLLTPMPGYKSFTQDFVNVLDEYVKKGGIIQVDFEDAIKEVSEILETSLPDFTRSVNKILQLQGVSSENVLHKAINSVLQYADALNNTANLIATRQPYMLTEKDVYGALKGSGAFGTATTPITRQLIADGVLQGMAVRDAGYLPTLAGYITQNNADIIRYVTSQALKSQGYVVKSGGLLEAGAGGILQVDAIAEGVFNGAQRAIPIQIMSTSDQRLATLVKLAGDAVGGIHTLDAAVLASINPEAYTELGAIIKQLSTAGDTGLNTGLIAAFNKDFSIKDTSWMDYYEHYLGSLSDGKIFSTEAVEQFKVLRNLFDLSDAEVAAKHFREVILPTFGIFIDDATTLNEAARQLGGTLSTYRDALTYFKVDYTGKQLGELNPLPAADAATQMRFLTNDMLEAGVSPDGLKKLLFNYVTVNENAGRFANEVLSVDFNAPIRQYVQLRDSVNKWASNILKEDVRIARATRFPKKFAARVDGIMADYFNGLAGASEEEIAKLLKTTQKRLRDAAASVKNIGLSSTDASKVRKALYTLSDELEHVDPTSMLVRSYIDTLDEINRMVEANIPLDGAMLRRFDSLTRTTSQLVNKFGMGTEQFVAHYVDDLNVLNQLLREQYKSGVSAGIKEIISEPLDSLFKGVDATGTLRYAIEAAMDMVAKGVVTVSDDFLNRWSKTYADIVGSDQLKDVLYGHAATPANKFVGVPTVTGTPTVIDFETFGLPATVSSGEVMPRVFSAASYNPVTQTLDELYVLPDHILEAIKNGNSDARALIKDWLKGMRSISDEFREIYSDPAIIDDIMAKGVSFEEAQQRMLKWVTENPSGFTGYNAVNTGNAGGAFDYRMLTKAMQLDEATVLAKINTDVMSEVTGILSKYTGTNTTLKLTELREILGITDDYVKAQYGLSGVSHTAGFDTMVTDAVHKALADGRFEAIVRNAQQFGWQYPIENPNGTIGVKGDIKGALKYQGAVASGQDVVPWTRTAAQAAEAAARRASANNLDDVVAGLYPEYMKQYQALHDLLAGRAAALQPPVTQIPTGEAKHVAGSAFDIGGARAAAQAAAGGPSYWDAFGSWGSRLKRAIHDAFGKLGLGRASDIFGDASAVDAAFNADRANADTWVKRVLSRSGWKHTAPSMDDIFAAFDDLARAENTPLEAFGNRTMGDIRRVKNAADAAVAGGASADTEWIKTAYKTYNEALNAGYADVADNFYKNVINHVAGQLGDAKNELGFLQTLGKLDENMELLSFTLSKDGGFKLINNALITTKKDLWAAAVDAGATAMKRAGAFGDIAKNGKQIDDAIEAVADAFRRAYSFKEAMTELGKLAGRSDEVAELAKAMIEVYQASNGLKNIDDIGPAAKAFIDGVNKMGKNTVIMDAAANMSKGAGAVAGSADDLTRAADDVLFSGQTASKLVNGAADTVANSFKNVGKRLIDGVANFGILDVAAAGIQSAMQHFEDKRRTEEFGGTLDSVDSTGILKDLNAHGYNVGEVIGEEVFHGALEELGFGLINGVTSSLAITATTAAAKAAGAALGAKIGASLGSLGGPIGTAIGIAAGVVVGLITDKVIEATGGHTLTNLYADDYIKAIGDGSLLDRDKANEAYRESHGRDMTDDEFAEAEREARIHTAQLVYGDSKYGFWEQDDLNKILYGNSSGTNYSNNATADSVNAIRLAEAFGALGDLRIGSTTLYDQYAGSEYGPTSLGTYMSIKDPVALDDESLKLLGEIVGGELEVRSLDDVTDRDYNMGGYGLYDKTNDRWVSSIDNYTNDTDIAALRDAVRAMYTYGDKSGALAEQVTEVIAGNATLRQAVAEDVGYARYGAYNNLEAFLPMLEHAMGQQYSWDTILGDDQLSLMLSNLATGATAANLAAYESMMNTAKGNGATGTTLFGADLSGVTSETLEALSKLGLNIASKTETIDPQSDLVNSFDMSFVTLTKDMEALKENLAGFRVDASTFEGLDFANLTLTADQAEILAQAGIQINSNGTIDFMSADQDDKYGTTRGFTLTEDSVSDAVEKALGDKGFTITYATESDKGSVAIDRNSIINQVKGGSGGAMFALPSGWEGAASQEVINALEKVGDFMDSGYFMLTDKALLNGDKTISAYLTGLLGEGHMSADVATVIGNLDESVQGGLDTFATGLVIPSPIPEDWLTGDLRAAFAESGIQFQEYNGQLMMIMNSLNDTLVNGVSLVDAAQWNALPESLRTALAEMGVITSEQAGQVMVDLHGVMDGGVVDVISLFIDQPEVWQQIPDTVKQYLANTVLETENGMLEIKQMGSGVLVDINGTWVTKWENITSDIQGVMGTNNKNVEVSLSELSKKIDDGLLTIDGVITEADIPTLTDDQIAVPFSELPPEVQASLTGPGGLDGVLDGDLVVCTATAREGFANLVGEATAAQADFEGATEGVGTAADGMAQAIADAVYNAQLQINQLQQLQSRVGTHGGSWFFNMGAKDNTIGAPVQYKNANGQSVTMYPEYAGDKVTKWHWFDPVTGAEKSAGSIPSGYTKAATGGVVTGLTLTGEEGREMAILPDGSIRMLGADGRGELLDLPEGTRVLNNQDTEDILKYTGPISNLSKLADGNADVVVGGAAAQETEDEFKATFLTFMKAFIAAFGVNEEGAETDITAVETPGVTAGDSYVAESNAVALRGFSAALFEILESWRNDKSGLEALGNKFETVASDAANKVIASVDNNTDAVRNIRLSATSYDYDREYKSATTGLTLDTSGVVDDEAYDWLQDVIDAKREYAAATTDEERQAAHEKAERARMTQGFMGGPDGSQFIASGGVQADWVKEIFAARDSYLSATTDTERELAHLRAEIARATQGFSGGLDGSAFKLLSDPEVVVKELTAEYAALLGTNVDKVLGVIASDEQLKAMETATTADADKNAVNLLTKLGEMLNSWSSFSTAERDAILAQISQASAEISAVLSSYAAYTNEQINSLRSSLNNLQFMNSVAERSSDRVKGSAKGSLVTEDALYRAGELGLNEAIIPLEQPDVMADVGAAIAEYMPEGDTTVVQATPTGFAEALREQTETLEIAIRGAVAAITENQSNHTTQVVTDVNHIIDVVDKNLGKLESLEAISRESGNLSGSVNSLGTQLAGIVDALKNISQTYSDMYGAVSTTATEATLVGLPDALSGQFGEWWTASMAAARAEYGSATTDAGRSEAHRKAEDLRALLGYSGGPDGSQYIPLSGDQQILSVEYTQQLFDTLLALLKENANQEASRDAELQNKQNAFYDRLLASNIDSLNKHIASDNSIAASIVSAIQSGCSSVASAVGSYVDWSQNTIRSLENQVAALQAAASQAERGSSTIKGSASGSLVTKDALYRAGELGLNEAIIPLEKPSVLAQVGDAIAGAMPEGDGTTVNVTEAAPPVDLNAVLERMDLNTETMALAIRGAVAAITENDANHTDGLMVNIDAINKTVADNLGKLDALDKLSNLSGSIGSLGSAMDGVKEAVQSVKEDQAKDETVVSLASLFEPMFAGQAQEATLLALPDSLGASLTEQANSLIQQGKDMWAAATTDEEREAAHAMAESGRAMLGYSGGPDGSQYIPLDEDTTAAIGSLSEGMTILVNYEAILEALEAARSKQSDTEHTDAMSKLGQNTQQLLSKLSASDIAVTSALLALGQNLAGTISSAAAGIITAVNGIRINITYVTNSFGGGSSSSGKGKGKGSARGSLVTEDALYRAGELGLNEAIIPLERPDIMRQVGSTIASFMPVEQRVALAPAVGLQNGGVHTYSPAPPMQQDPTYAASSMAQRVLEQVLPQIAAMQSDDPNDKRPLYVGTLIADERGLKQLERKLYDIRQTEAARR